jgi:hypothetical protein
VQFVVVGEGQGVDLSGEVAEEQVELAQGLFVLELELQVAHIFEHWQTVGPVDHEHCAVHPFDGKLDMLADADLDRLLLLVVE